MSFSAFKALVNPSASYIGALNYSSLNTGNTTGALAYVQNSQGTAWLPYTWVVLTTLRMVSVGRSAVELI